MKKCLAFILVCVLMCVTAYAEPCPLPCPANTHADIKFQSYEWYADYPTTLATAKSRGLSDEWFMDWFYDDMCTTPHWRILLNSIKTFAGSETRCGGNISFSSDIPNVAGYRVKDLELYFMWNEETGYTKDYKKPGAVQFYMAMLELDIDDNDACYNDLVTKLMSLYGSKPYSDTYGWVDPTRYTVWVNDEGAMVGVSCDAYTTTLVYMAPGAEEKLVNIENLNKKQDIDNAKGDMTGL